jgi:Holliday junction DNA helicase RuvA
MIARLTGELVEIRGDRAWVEPGHGLTYEVMLPAFAAVRLAASEGQTVTLHTFQFIESTAQGATMFPRLAGFATAEDKAFFELFVTCKGIGHKRALRAMVLDTGTLAGAIADRDVKLIQTMPEVGKKLAETIVVTLRDKVEGFTGVGQRMPAVGFGGGTEAGSGGRGGGLAREALEVLVQLGENRSQALQWVDRVLAGDDRPEQVQDVVAAVYRIKAGS